MDRFFAYLAHGLFALVVALGAAWSATALWLHLTGGIRIVALAGIALAALAALALRWRARRYGWTVVAVAAIVVAGWYQTITPQQDRHWATDVARGVKAQVTGHRVRLIGIRDFDWHSETEATQRWITRSYDLDALETVDMFTSTWDRPGVAHLLVSFGFAGGAHVVFSVEIRRERGEAFSEIGGFFRQYELVLIGATESDIIKLRTNYRHEQVRMFPVHLDAEQRRELFMAYVGLADQLQQAPEFYNTLTANCTTVVYQIARVLKSDLPLDWRLVMSGHLPAYLAELGVVDGADAAPDGMKAALITDRALSAQPGVPYSQAIRRDPGSE